MDRKETNICGQEKSKPYFLSKKRSKGTTSSCILVLLCILLYGASFSNLRTSDTHIS